MFSQRRKDAEIVGVSLCVCPCSLATKLILSKKTAMSETHSTLELQNSRTLELLNFSVHILFIPCRNPVIRLSISACLLTRIILCFHTLSTADIFPNHLMNPQPTQTTAITKLLSCFNTPNITTINSLHYNIILGTIPVLE